MRKKRRYNRYHLYAHLSERRFEQVVRCFADDLTARQCAAQTGISARTVNELYGRLRERIARDEMRAHAAHPEPGAGPDPAWWCASPCRASAIGVSCVEGIRATLLCDGCPAAQRLRAAGAGDTPPPPSPRKGLWR